MSKIDFGYNNDNYLNSQFEGFENSGEFVDVVNCNGGNYLISNIFGRYNVKEICQDIYPDGSYSTYARGGSDKVCISMMLVLNRMETKEKIQNGFSTIDILNMSGFDIHPANLRPVTTEYENTPGLVTSIQSELFEDLKNTKRFNHNSHYELCKQIEMLQMQLDQLKQEQEISIKK